MNSIFKFFFLFVAYASLNAATIPPAPSQYFNDYAGVIAPRSVANFNDVLAQFERETLNQIIVVFFSKVAPNTTIEQFAEEVFRAWKPGQAGRNNGVLVLVFVDDRKVRIQTGLGLENALPDNVCGEIIARDIAPNFRKGDYNTGIEAALNSIMNATRDTYKGDGQTVAEKNRGRQQNPSLALATRQEYEDMLKIRRELAQKDPDAYLPSVAQVLVNLGQLDYDEHRTEQARQEFDEALKVFRELAQKHPGAYLADLAQMLHNLGVLDFDQKRMEEARQEYEEALQIRRELAQKDPATYLPDLAWTLYNLGRLDYGEHRMKEARQEYEEALKIRRELAQKDPDAYLPSVAQVLANLGQLDNDEHRTEQARQEFDEALKVFRELAQKHPGTLPQRIFS